MSSQQLFETDRLTVRQMCALDLADMLRIYGDAEAMKWVGDGLPITQTECDQWLQVTRDNYERRGYGMSVLQSRLDQTIVGFCGLVHPGQQTTPELKYALAREVWGQGLATEAARGMVRYGQTEFEMSTIIATVSPANAASKRVLTKAGFRWSETCDGTDVFTWRDQEQLDSQ